MIAQQLIKKYNLAADSYYSESPYNKKSLLEISSEGITVEANLYEKWKPNIPDGWYGLSVGWPVPLVWYSVIGEFLDYVKLEKPDFQLLQIKIKYGGIRIHLDNVPLSIYKEADELEVVLYDKFLIW